MSDELTLDGIEDRNEAGGYHDAREIRALVNEVKRLRAVIARHRDGCCTGYYDPAMATDFREMAEEGCELP